MIPLEHLAAFALTAAVVAMTPGSDTALVLRTAAVAGPRPAAAAALGVGLGCLAWGAAVSAGLAAIIAASPLAYALLTYAGAAYLVWIGARMILAPRGSLRTDSARTAGREAAEALRRGLVTNLLNPKVGVFYLSLLPQFVPAGDGAAALSMLLASIHVGWSLAWFALLIGATVPAGRWLSRPKVVATLDRLTGIVFVGFGVRLALSRAP